MSLRAKRQNRRERFWTHVVRPQGRRHDVAGQPTSQRFYNLQEVATSGFALLAMTLVLLKIGSAPSSQ